MPLPNNNAMLELFDERNTRPRPFQTYAHTVIADILDETPDTCECDECGHHADSIGWYGDQHWFECLTCGTKQAGVSA